QIQLEENDEALTSPFEPQATNRSNQDYTYDKVDVIIRATQTKVELEQYDQYCPEQAFPVMTLSSIQTSDNSKQIIQLLQKQIKQQVQVIAMLQEQTQIYKAQ
ncbi:2497_t:CDS:2, partial [Cetraspora pellucida]